MRFFRECFIKEKNYIFNLAMKNKQRILQLDFFKPKFMFIMHVFIYLF